MWECFEHRSILSECLCRSKPFISVVLQYLAESVCVWSRGAAFMECCWVGQWPEPTCMAVVLLDLCDRLLKLTDSPALQAAMHQPIDLLQPWEHRHVCVWECVCMYACVWQSQWVVGVSVEQTQGLLLSDKACWPCNLELAVMRSSQITPSQMFPVC